KRMSARVKISLVGSAFMIAGSLALPAWGVDNPPPPPRPNGQTVGVTGNPGAIGSTVGSQGGANGAAGSPQGSGQGGNARSGGSGSGGATMCTALDGTYGPISS